MRALTGGGFQLGLLDLRQTRRVKIIQVEIQYKTCDANDTFLVCTLATGTAGAVRPVAVPRLMGTRQRGPAVVTQQVDSGQATLVPDQDRPGSWLLRLDGTPQSHVDLTDPTALSFEYMRRLAAVADTTGDPGGPLRVLHLGGGALTLPRYLAATRPGSRQRVVEHDAALIAFVRRELPLPRRADLRIRAADGRVALTGEPDARYDLVVADVFGGAQVPGRFATVEFATQAARVLRPDGGRYAVNLADGPPLRYTRKPGGHPAGGVRRRLPDRGTGVLRRRRFGNVVLVASRDPGGLPVAELATRAARDSCPARVVHGGPRPIRGWRPAITDATAVDSPPPPPACSAEPASPPPPTRFSLGRGRTRRRVGAAAHPRFSHPAARSGLAVFLDLLLEFPAGLVPTLGLPPADGLVHR